MAEKNIIGICGSLRRASRNMGLLRCARQQMPEGTRLEIVDISSFPFYSADIEKPEQISVFVDKVKSAAGYVFAGPEYNYSVAPALKNAIDWASREPGAIFAGKPAALMGAGGSLGSARAQYHLRQICVYLDLQVVNKPEIFANAFSPAFAEDGSVADTAEGQKLAATVAELMRRLCAGL